MNSLIEQINMRTELLKSAIKKAEKDSGPFPEGKLRMSRSGTQKRFFKISPDTDSLGEYISMKDKDLIRGLAQKDYHSKFLTQASAELKRLEKTKAFLTNHNSDLVYDNLSQERKKLVSPYIIPDDIYAGKWLVTPYKSNPYMEENKIYDTRKGEKVRSKSEAILADMLYELGIPYQYEKAIRLKNGITRYPDFTLLKVETKEEIYLEHFGLLDDEEYRNASMKKLNEYRQNGIYPGKNLILTYETEEYPLDISGIKEMLKELLL